MVEKGRPGRLIGMLFLLRMVEGLDSGERGWPGEMS